MSLIKRPYRSEKTRKEINNRKQDHMKAIAAHQKKQVEHRRHRCIACLTDVNTYEIKFSAGSFRVCEEHIQTVIDNLEGVREGIQHVNK